MEKWIYHKAGWQGALTWDAAAAARGVAAFEAKLGELRAAVAGLDAAAQDEFFAECAVVEAMFSAKIEGVPLKRRDLLRVYHGLGAGGAAAADAGLARAAAFLPVVLEGYAAAAGELTKETLWRWHGRVIESQTGVFGEAQSEDVTLGGWRRRAMWVGKGQMKPAAKDYVALAPGLVAGEMAVLLEWINGDSWALAALVAAAIGHFRYELIHPLDDGNGRTGRVVLEQILSREYAVLGRRGLALSLAIWDALAGYYGMFAAHDKFCAGEKDITGVVDYIAAAAVAAAGNSVLLARAIAARRAFWAGLDAAARGRLNAAQAEFLLRHVARLPSEADEGFSKGAYRRLRLEAMGGFEKDFKRRANAEFEEVVGLLGVGGS